MNPIERAEKAIKEATTINIEGIDIIARAESARAAFESIDADQLADVILAANLFGDGTAMDAAQAVKNWLTGKDQP